MFGGILISCDEREWRKVVYGDLDASGGMKSRLLDCGIG